MSTAKIAIKTIIALLDSLLFSFFKFSAARLNENASFSSCAEFSKSCSSRPLAVANSLSRVRSKSRLISAILSWCSIRAAQISNNIDVAKLKGNLFALSSRVRLLLFIHIHLFIRLHAVSLSLFFALDRTVVLVELLLQVSFRYARVLVAVPSKARCKHLV